MTQDSNIRVVIDTSVLISALITKNTPPDNIYQAWQENKFTLLCCDPQIEELKRVILYPKLKKFVTKTSAQIYVSIKLYFVFYIIICKKLYSHYFALHIF